jgi:ankyrin repeat protein
MPKIAKGTRKNTKTGHCERSGVKESKRCANRTRKNKKTGGSPKDSPKSTDDLDSIGIIPHLRAPRGYTTYYGRADVDKENADNDAAVKRYLDNPKFNPNAIDKHGNTPLHVAVERRRDEVVKKLLARKDTRVDIRNKDDKLAVEIAQEINNRNAIAYFNSSKHKKELPEAIRKLL